MRKEEIDILLNKYYEGLSTGEEEKRLREFFTGNDCPAGYEAEKAMFDYYSSSSLPAEGLEERILASLDAVTVKKSVVWKAAAIRYAGIAASVMILVASWFFFNRDRNVDTFSDPEIAYAETMKILYDVSLLMNSGASQLKPVSKINIKNIEGLEVLAKSKATLDENLMNLNQLEELIGEEPLPGKTKNTQ